MGFAAAVIIENDREEILLLQRGSTAPWKPGWWNLPGGMPEDNEQPHETAPREAKEETGLTVRNLHHVVDEVSDDGTVVVTYHTRDYEGTLRLSWENPVGKWVPKAEVFNYQIVPGIHEALRRVVAVSAANKKAS
jgi:8-oxo-dGTP pyrophosphatase MutT (NUDIX family)